ncbi:hypothetical protein LguiA_020687 [Lonicera macranthoides]
MAGSLGCSTSSAYDCCQFFTKTVGGFDPSSPLHLHYHSGLIIIMRVKHYDKNKFYMSN